MTTVTRPSVVRLYAMFLIGAGLISIGLMFFIYLNSQIASATDFSTVPVQVNYAEPELLLTDLSGNNVSLSKFHGQVVLINLWATWCPPCKEEMPTLLAFYEKYKSNGFILIGVDQGETKEAVEPFVDEFKLTFPIWMDATSQAGREFNTISLPSSYVIDRKGRVRLMWIGGISKSNLNKYVPSVIME